MKNVPIEPEKYLPTSEEIDQMDRHTFISWVSGAGHDIKERINKRDPIAYLQKKVSEMLAQEYSNEAEKERKIDQEIARISRKYGLGFYD